MSQKKSVSIAESINDCSEIASNISDNSVPAPFFEESIHPFFIFENSFTDREHKKIARRIKKLSVPWVLTYDYVDEILDMYSFCNKKEYELSYTVENKRIGNEVMFFNDTLTVDF